MLPASLPVAILAGGLGTRLRSVVADRPKVLAEVCGRPFLAWWLDALERQGARDVILCTGYMADLIRETFGASFGSLNLHYSVEHEPLGTGGAVRLAWSQGKPENLLVLNGDSFCPQDLSALWTFFQQSGGAGAMVLRHLEDTRRYGRVTMDSNSRIQSFEEKSPHSAPGYINAGLYLLNSSLLKPLPEARPFSLEKDLFPAWLKQGIYGLPSKEAFLDIGTPESYALAENFLRSLAGTRPAACPS